MCVVVLNQVLHCFFLYTLKDYYVIVCPTNIHNKYIYYKIFQNLKSYTFQIIQDSCETSNCGPNKRCVIRNGRPKCICAPNCKKYSSQNKTNQNHHHHLPTASSHSSKRKRRHHQMLQSQDENAEILGNLSSMRSRRWTDDSVAHHNNNNNNNDTWNSVSVVVKIFIYKIPK